MACIEYQYRITSWSRKSSCTKVRVCYFRGPLNWASWIHGTLLHGSLQVYIFDLYITETPANSKTRSQFFLITLDEKRVPKLSHALSKCFATVGWLSLSRGLRAWFLHPHFVLKPKPIETVKAIAYLERDQRKTI